MLQITNGDSTARLLEPSGAPGDVLPWREALAIGPAPQIDDRSEWLATRSRFLAEEYEVGYDDCLADLEKQERMLDAIASHEEVTLWFEHDLFCQINLIYLLDRIEALAPAATTISLVAIDSFPGIEHFRGLGQLAPSDLGVLYTRRATLTARELSLGARAWRAYRSADPTAVEALLAEDTSALPYLHDALTRHLARFPSTSNGLGAVEQMALTLIDSGIHTFTRLFNELATLASGYGYGDFQFWCDLERLASARRPLIAIEGLADRDHPLSSGAFRRASFNLTVDGREVLSGSADAVHLNGVDRWIGGAHLESNGMMWRWNRDLMRLLGI